MDKIENYQKILCGIINEYAGYKPRNSPYDWVPICDDKNREYLLMSIGWDEKENHKYHSIFHFRIKENKIYVEQDNTDADPVQQMLDAGVPKEDIVLAFYSPSHRKLTEFALA